MKQIFKRELKKEDLLDNLLVYIIVGTIIGARLAHCLIYEPDYYLAQPFLILKVWEGGLASHGGALGIVFACWLHCRKVKDYSLMWLFDRLSLPVILGGAFIRMGNFFNSEIVGVKTMSGFGVIFERIDQYPRHPVQLYESISYFVVFVALLLMYRSRSVRERSGLIMGTMLVLVFSARFCLEFVKISQASYAGNFSISVGQWLSIPAILIGIFFVVKSLCNKS